jgi:hypothetical protein
MASVYHRPPLNQRSWRFAFNNLFIVQLRHSTEEKILGRPRLLVAGLMLFAGGLLWALSVADLYPMKMLARMFSEDGVLSASYVRLIQDSQFKLAFSFLLAGALFSWINAQRIIQFMLSLAFWKVATIAGLLAGLLSYAVQEWLFNGIPHVTDATSHLFQAKIFALGRMYVPAPPCPDAFWQPNVIMTTSGKWFTKYTPGHALLLAGGMRLGLLRWTLPLCVAGTLVVLGKTLAIHDRKIDARLYMLLFALSPLSVLLGGSYMSHCSAMAFAVTGLFFWIQSPRMKTQWAVSGFRIMAGFFLLLSAITRPHEFVLMGLTGFLFFLTLKREEWLRMFRDLPLLLVGAIPVFVFWLFWNQTLYGTPLAIGYGYTTGEVIRPSFQGRFGFTSSFGLQDAMSVLVWNIDRFNGSFLGWPASLLFVPFAFLRGGNRLVRLAGMGIAVVLGFYFFYNYRAEYEARYYFLALPLFLYLTVNGMRNVVLFRDSAAWREGASQVVFLLCTAFFLYAALFYWPDYLIPRYRDAYEDCSTVVEKTVREQGLANAVVMIAPDNGDAFFSSGFIYNDPLLERNVIYARQVGSAGKCLRQAFPGRSFYQYEKSINGDGILSPLN